MWRMLAIGGIDPSGGAGVELDVKVGEAFDVHVHPVATMVTYQTPLSYLGGLCLDSATVINQLNSFSNVKYWKTGALCSEETAKALLEKAKKYKPILVVDPVLKASAGGTLYSGSIDAYLELIKHSFAVTPNRMEAEELLGVSIEDVEDALSAARRISELGPKLVIITGGHMNELADVIYFEDKHYIIRGKRRESIHGSGSTLASALTALLAKGTDPVNAARRAIGYTRLLHIFARDVEGRIPDPLIFHRLAYYRHECQEAFRAFLRWLESLEYEKAKLIAPEVGINVACAVPRAVTRGIGTVLGIPGRLHLTPYGLRKVACPWWGGSEHMGRLILTARKYADVNAAMNVKYSERNVELLKEAGFKVVEVDRKKQPRGIKTMKWVIEEAVRVAGSLPDVIYDRGFYGKEAMIRLLAKDLKMLREMVLAILV